MEEKKKIKRGFKDFAHLFISSQAEKIAVDDVSESSERSSIYKYELSKPIFCFTSLTQLEERNTFILKTASELINSGKKVLIIDADFSVPRLSMNKNVNQFFSVMNLLNGNPKTKLFDQPDVNLKVITVDIDMSDLSLLNIQKRIFIKQFFRLSEEKADTILISVPSKIKYPMVLNLIKASNWLITIASKEKEDMIETYRLFKSIFNKIKDISFGIAVSGVGKHEESVEITNIIRRVSNKYLSKGLKNFGYIQPAQNGGKLSEKIDGVELNTLIYNSNLSDTFLELLHRPGNRNGNLKTKYPLTNNLIK